MPMRNVNFGSARELTEFVNTVQKVSAAAVVAGGSGYAVNDILSVVGGAGERIAQLKVATVTGTAVATVTVEEEGAYTTNPTNPVSVVGGGGNGATFNLTIIDAIAGTANIVSIDHRKGRWYLEYWT